jgi:Phage tail tube protein
MSTVNRIGGTMSIRVDGQQYEARGNFRVKGMAYSREGVAGQDFVHGYIETPIVPEISGDWSIGAQLSIQSIENITNSTAVAALANGVTYTLANCWAKSGSVIDCHDGKVEVVLQGLTLSELGAAATVTG